MTTALPASVTYGVFKGQVLRAVADTNADSDLLPDKKGCTGYFLATPTVPYVTLGDDEIVLFLDPIKIELDKVNGTGTFQGTLIANDNPAMNPPDWGYIVSSVLDGGAVIKSFPLSVTTNSVRDLTKASPVIESNGVFITKGDDGASIASAEVIDGQLVFTLDDQTVLAPVPLVGMGGSGGYPVAHAASHAIGGSDILTPAAIGSPSLADLEPPVDLNQLVLNALA